MAENYQERSDRSEEMEPGQKKSGASNRGFASMDPQQQRMIASKGGQAAHKQGVAHQWNSDEAREAGRKGGQASGRRNSKNKPSSEDAKDQTTGDSLPPDNSDYNRSMDR